ncbi:MAG: glycosyltransferase family 2 protein [Bacteroidales bacterium]
MKKIAVVILNWNGRDLLKKYLPSVVAYTDPSLSDIYVADNGSDDDSIEMLQSEFPSVGVVRLDRNYGFAGGYNQVIEQIEEEYVLLLNSDVRVSENWLAPLYTYMESHPLTAACQPKIRSDRDPEMFEHAGAAGGFIDRWGYPFCRGRLFHVLEKDQGQYETVMPVFWATGAALLTRTALFKSMGGLDASFFAHMEEIDYCWRLWARGYDIVAIPSSTVYHLGGATLQKESPRKTYLNFRNNLLMLYKNEPKWICRRVLLARFFLDLVAATKMFVTGERANAKAVLCAVRDFYQTRHRYRSKRNQNEQLRKRKSIPSQYKGSLLIDFYLRGIRKFSQMKPYKNAIK